jgi:hypothetical protein
MGAFPGEVSGTHREKQTIVNSLYTYQYQLRQIPLPN